MAVVSDIEIRLRADIARLQQDMNGARRSVDGAMGGITRAANLARNALAGIAAGIGLGELARMTDQYTRFTAQLKLATNSQKEYAQSVEDVKRISTSAQNDIGATGVLYARILASTRELGVSQSQVAKVTETVNLALAATGAGASESASAMLQLSQAFGSGVLRGEEFNAVYEAAPELLRILARDLDIPIGKLRKLAEAGALTSDKLVKAFSNNEVIDSLRGNVAQITTISGAYTVFKNNLIEIIGTQAHASGTVKVLTSALLGAAGAVKVLSDGLGGALKIAAAYVAAFVVAPALFQFTATAMGNLRLQIALAKLEMASGASVATLFSASIGGVGIAAQWASGMLGKLTIATSLAFAAFAGWEIGKYLESQFVEVEIAAEVMTGELLKAWQVLKFAFKDAFDAITLTAREGIAFLTRGMAGWFGIVADGMRLIGKTDAANGVDKFAASIVNATAVQGTYASRSAEARAAMEKEIKLIDLDTERRSNNAYMRGRIVEAVGQSEEQAAAVAAAAAAATKEQIAEAKRQADAYRGLVTALEDRVAATARELAGLAPLTVAEKAHLDLTREIAEGKLKLSVAQEANARSLIDEAGANDVLIKSNQEWLSLQQQLVDNNTALAAERYALIDSAKSEAEQNERLVATYGMSESAIIRYNSARLMEQEAKRLGRELNAEEIADLERVIELRNRSAEALAKKDDLDRMFDTTQVQSFGDALRDAFSEAGTAMGKLGGALGGYVSKQIGAQKSIAQAKLKYADDDKRFALEVGRINAQQERERLGAYAEITGAAKGFFKEGTTGYNVLAGAEKAFRLAEIASQMQSLYTHLFVTTSKAAGTVSGQAVETAAVKTGEAARNAAKIPGVFMSFMSALGPWGMAAAGVAIAAVLGGAFSGGKASTAVRAEDVQKAQGTGGVFGDSSAKSDSISRSLELIEKNSDMLLPLTQNMLGALRGIEAAMGGLANLVARTAGLTTGSGFGIETGQLNIGKPTDAISKVMTGITEGLLGPGLGGKVASFINNIWGKTKQEITDSGLQFGGSVASLQAGAGFQQYANVSTTKSSFFGLSKKTTDSLQTAALDADIAKQFGMVFTSLETVLRSAATGLGRDGDAVGEAVRSTIIDMTKLSLKGLSGDELADAINAVISKASDDVAMAALPGFDDFRKLGEGYTETIVRVASGIESAQYELERLGISAIAYADIANKQGDVGAEIVRQSILTVESLAGVRDIMSGLGGSASELAETYGQLRTAQDAMRMVNLDPGTLDVKLLRGAGGLDNLQSALEDYFDGFFSEAEQIAAQTDSLGRQFAALGLAMPATNDAFRDLVNATPELRGQLLLLAGGFADLMADTNSALSAEAERATSLAADRRQLEIELMEASGDAAGALAARRVIEIAAADESLRPLLALIHARQDETAALEKNEEALRAGVDAAFAAVGRAVAAQRDQVTAAYKAVTDRIAASITTITARVTELTRLSDALAGSLTAVESDTQSVASRSAARSQVQAAIAIAKASGVLPSVEQLQGALSTLKLDSSDQFSSLVEYQREVARTNAELQMLGGLTNKQLTDSQRQLAILEDQKAMAERQYAAEMERLDGILEWAQAEVDAINGVRTDVQSVVAAIAGLQVAAAALGQGATASNPTGGALTVEDLYRTVLGRDGEAAGIAYWKGVFGSVVDSTEYAQFIKGAEYELGLKQPPIAYTAPSSGTMPASTVNALQEEMSKRMDAKLTRMADGIDKFSTQFENVSGGGQSLFVENVNAAG